MAWQTQGTVEVERFGASQPLTALARAGFAMLWVSRKNEDRKRMAG